MKLICDSKFSFSLVKNETWSVENYISEEQSVATVGTPTVKGKKRKLGNSFKYVFLFSHA